MYVLSVRNTFRQLTSAACSINREITIRVSIHVAHLKVHTHTHTHTWGPMNDTFYSYINTA